MSLSSAVGSTAPGMRAPWRGRGLPSPTVMRGGTRPRPTRAALKFLTRRRRTPSGQRAPLGARPPRPPTAVPPPTPAIRKGSVYSDCRVDDSRLTIANAVGAREKGAAILTRTRFTGAKRVDGVWEATIAPPGSDARTIRARALVNAAGPWVVDVLDRIEGDRITARVRLVKGSHIIVPKVHSQGHAYLLQNPDKRVVFVIPYENAFSLIGTTDVPVSGLAEAAAITPQETAYLLSAANRFLAKPLAEADIVSSYAGVRPLYDDGSDNPSEVTRDSGLNIDHEQHKVPLLSIFGGKITTYRRLAEEACAMLQPFFPEMKEEWTTTEPLPGGNVRHYNGFRDEMHAQYRPLGRELVEAIVRRHGARAPRVLGEATSAGALGRNFGAALTEREIEYFAAEEWAANAEDVLWRRTKCGLHMTLAQRDAVDAFMKSRRGGRCPSAL